MEYQIEILRKGDNQVRVLRKRDDSTFDLAWTFRLKGDSEPVLIAEMIDDDRFVVVNWNAWVRMYSISEQRELLNQPLNGALSSGAVLSDDLKYLYVLCRDRSDDQQYLTVFDLEQISIPRRFILPPEVPTDNCRIGPGGDLLIYFSDKKGETFEHGYFRLNPLNGDLDFFSLPYPSLAEFSCDQVLPAISKKHGLGAMPFWTSVDIEGHHPESAGYIFKIVLFDLHQFQVTDIFPVRKFTYDELGCHDYNSSDMAEAFFNADKEDDDYTDAMVEFIDNLNTIRFDEKAPFLWLCFREGIVRKVYFDGTLSPQFVSTDQETLPQHRDQQLVYFHCEIDHIFDEHHLILKDNSGECYIMDVPETPQKAAIEEKIAIPRRSFTREVVVPAETRERVSEMGYAVINIADTDSAPALLEGLEQMRKLLEDVEDIRNGFELKFLIKDNKGRKLKEPAFFEKVMQLPEGPAGVSEVIETFVKYPKADQLYRDEETTALAHAVFELARHGETYLDTVLTYLIAMDYEHDCFNKENVIPLLQEQYTGTAKEQHILKRLQSIEDPGWYHDFSS